MQKPIARASEATADLIELVGRLRAEVAALSERMARLEAAGAPGPTLPAAAPPLAPASVPEPAPPAPSITEEEILAVSAALAAYLGVRPRIRQIRLIGSPAWAQQGRVSIQASHHLHG
ncbi:MAG TPA: hypothetical protein VFG59_01025 [Anaeromyxobacter sp.]|nr:hypothetical protein [Anaeromyxobacter sp.]